MTHTILDIAVYTYAAAWTIGLIISTKPNSKLYRFCSNLFLTYRRNFDKEDLVSENLKRLHKIAKKPGEKEFNINGTKVCAKTFKDAHKKYMEVRNMKVVYEEIKL